MPRIASAPFAGAVSTWSQQAYVKASNTRAKAGFDDGANFGSAVALSADGSTLAVGAPKETSAATGIGWLGQRMCREVEEGR